MDGAVAMTIKSVYLPLILVFGFGVVIGGTVEAKVRPPRRLRCEYRFNLPISANRCSTPSTTRDDSLVTPIPQVVDFDEWALTVVPDPYAESAIVQARKIDASTER